MKRFLSRWWFLLLLVGGLHISYPPPPVNAVALGSTLVADTVHFRVTWQNPAPNGLPYDAVQVRVPNIMAGGWLTQRFTPPFPTSAEFTQVVTHGPGTFAATYRLPAQVCITQNGQSACALGWTTWSWRKPGWVPPDSTSPVPRFP